MIESHISDTHLLLSLMGISQQKVTVYDDTHVSRNELVIIAGNGVTIFLDLLVLTEIIKPVTYIMDEGYQRPEDAEWKYHLQFEEFLFFQESGIGKNYREVQLKVTQDQIDNIVIPQLKNVITLC